MQADADDDSDVTRPFGQARQRITAFFNGLTTGADDAADDDDSAVVTPEPEETGTEAGELADSTTPADEVVAAPATTTPAAASTEPAPTTATPSSTSSWRNALESALTRTPAAPPGTPDRFSPYYSAQFLKAIEPITNAFTTVVEVMETVPRTLAALPTSKTPITDVITSVQYMLTTVAGAIVPIVYVPSNLYALMVTMPPVETPIFVGGVASQRPMPVPAEEPPLFGPLVSQAPYVAPAGAPLFGTMTPRGALGTVVGNGLIKPLSVSGTVPSAPETAKPPAVKSFLDHVVSAVLVPASLTALAALALPGVAGLLIIVAAGIRLGYRQAKAAFAVRASGIARFAGPGPLGVVRSGSLITFRQRARGPRTARAVCPQANNRTVRKLEEVA
ncbi:hypothetical protein [Mycolicibacterium pulveris]|uniref:hypothetical protein n=1 Tax=Mycolicibacterium pulveris TaxID=36813 RepID=UPI003CEF1830